MSNNTSEEQQTYVHDGVEVRLTGRIANKTLRKDKVDVINEITPADKENGSWTKWVRMSDLYEIQ